MEKVQKLNDAYNELRKRGIAHNKREFAEKIGYNYNNIVNALNGKNNNYLTDDLFDSMVAKFDFLAEILGVDNKKNETDNEPYQLIHSIDELNSIPDKFKAWVKPFYPEMKVGAGMEFGKYRVPTQYFILVPHSEKVEFWVPVEGHSMYPKYSNRDLVGLSHIHFDGVFGGNNYVVALKTGSAHLKRVDFIKDNKDAINLHSYNPDFEDKEMEISKIENFFKVNMHIGFE